MKHLSLSGSKRTTGRKADVREVRSEGKVPCVIYGNGVENVSFSVDAKALKALTDTPYCHIVDLDVDGQKYTALLHEVQYHPVNDKALHADFLAVGEDKPVVVEVPVLISGNSVGVRAGGKLQVSRRKLKICGLLAKALLYSRSSELMMRKSSTGFLPSDPETSTTCTRSRHLSTCRRKS